MTKHQQIFNVLEGICGSVNRAEAMSMNELTTALSELKLEGGEHIASIESAVKGEAIYRLQHPILWRLEWIKNRKKRHANQV